MEERSLGQNHGEEERKRVKGSTNLILFLLLWHFIFYWPFLLALREVRVIYRILGHAVHGCQPEGHIEERER